MHPLFSAGGPKIEEEDEPEPPEPFEWTEDWGQRCGILPLPGNNKGNWYCENFDIVNGAWPSSCDRMFVSYILNVFVNQL